MEQSKSTARPWYTVTRGRVRFTDADGTAHFYTDGETQACLQERLALLAEVAALRGALEKIARGEDVHLSVSREIAAAALARQAGRGGAE